jgi:hypothetical protein
MTTPTPRPGGGTATLNAATRIESTARGFFHDPGHFLKDHTWTEHEGRWHVFYIRGDEAGSFHKQVDVDVGHASTADFKWSWSRCAYFSGCPTGWDFASQQPPLHPLSATGSTAAFEILRTQSGWLVSYYVFDPILAKTVLNVEPLVWHDGHPFIQAAWENRPR